MGCAGLFVALQCCMGGFPCCLFVLLVMIMLSRYCLISGLVLGVSDRSMYCWRQLLMVRCKC